MVIAWLHIFQLTRNPEDFVRKEYALALKLKKNIVPVAHEEFDWPDRSRLPKDCDTVMGLNAVKYVNCALTDNSFVLLRKRSPAQACPY